MLFVFAAIAFAFAQTVVFSDNFDSYTAGSHLAQSNSAWTTWSNAPGGSEDGVISTAQAASAPNSLLVNGSVDQVYPFGNYTTGHYTVTFNMYVPSTGNGGYFNIQHVLLQQWSYECYFYNNGTGYLKVGGSEINFNYPSNAWFPVVMDVDMDQDQTSLTINNVLVNSWPFHYTGDATTGGVNQLAGIDLYAGAPNNLSGTYYVDDFVVTELSAALVGEFEVSPETMMVYMNPNSTASEPFVMGNPGTGGTDFYITPTYVIPNPDPTPTAETQLKYYLDDPYTYVGWNGEASEVDIAVGFTSSALQQHIGRTLNEIHVFMHQALPTAKVRVYGMNNNLLHPCPGPVVYEQTFVPDSGWNSIQLNTPYLIDGGDLWFGVCFVQPEGAYLVPLDGALAGNYSCWYKRGSTWYNRFTGSDYDFNLCLGGKVNGTPITPWLTVTPDVGSINAGANVTATVTVNSNGMAVNDHYTVNLHCFSSDITNSEVILPVTVTVTDVSVNEHNQIEVKIYPNPATDYVQVSSEVIDRVEIHNMLGQKVFDGFYGDSHVVVSTDGMAPGTYVVTVTSNGTQITKQVVVK